MAQQAVQLQQQFQARQAQLQFLQQMPQQQQYMVSQQQFQQQQQQQLQQQHQQLEQLLLQQQVQRQNAQYPAEQTNQINQTAQNWPRHGQRWSRDKAQGQAPQEEEQVAEPRWDRRWGRNHEQPTATGATTEEPQSNTLVKIDWGRQQRAAFQRCFLPQCNTELPGAENLRHQMGILELLKMVFWVFDLLNPPFAGATGKLASLYFSPLSNSKVFALRIKGICMCYLHPLQPLMSWTTCCPVMCLGFAQVIWGMTFSYGDGSGFMGCSSLFIRSCPKHMA